MPIKVLCADDSIDITRLLGMAIEAQADMEAVSTLSTADRLVDEVREKQPDVIVLDLTMPGADVLLLIGQISASQPEARVIVYSGFDDAKRVDQAMDAGAWGYVSKHEGLEALLEAIRRVAGGEVVAPQ